MTLLELVLAYYRAVTAVKARARALAAGLWGEVDQRDLDGSWTSARTAERLFVVTATAQASTAAFAEAFADAALLLQGADPAPVAALAPRGLAGVASDGRGLETLLLQPMVATKTAIRDGAPPDRAVRTGGAVLDMLVGTQVVDAARVATGVATVARPAATGWVRMLVPPSCGRCAILAGRRYRWSQGFQRHPLCDCVHVPAAEDAADDLRTDPDAYFASLTPAEQDRYFTSSGARAIRDGADLNRVVNATGRAGGLSTAGGYRTTLDATTRRGTGRRVRLTPESIYQLAGDNRDEAVRLLQVHGYLT